MAEVRILQDGGKDIIPVTHEDAVLDSNGVKISDKYAKKEDLDNLSEYAKKEDLDNLSMYNIKAYSDDETATVGTEIDKLWEGYYELFQSANNGKQLIADAIGEPLSAEDTFSAMSNDINGLLSTFKTNMMKNGVTVNSRDKFKALIDKIATLADNEGGLQYVTGNATANGDVSYDFLSSDGTENGTIYIDLSNLGFTPMFVIVTYNNSPTSMSVYIDKSFGFYFSNYMNVKGKSFTILSYSDGSSGPMWHSDNNNLKIAATATGVHTYHAIGVGKEDTTLRDSLASILQEEGVSVTEEDDMASLITKVDEEFDKKNSSGGLDIISATELPATGEEGQICVITDTPVDSFILTSDLTVTPSNNIVLYMLNDMMNYTKMMGSTRLYINIARAQQFNNAKLDVYEWSNSSWSQLCNSSFIILSNGQVPSSSTGSIPIGTYWNYHTSGAIYCPSSSTYSYYTYYTEKLNFDKFNTIKFIAYTGTATAKNLYFGLSTVERADGRSASIVDSYCTATVYQSISSTTPTTFTLDISSFSGSGYLMLFTNIAGSQIYIKDIELY